MNESKVAEQSPDEVSWTAQADWMRRVGATSATWSLDGFSGALRMNLTSLELGPAPPEEGSEQSDASKGPQQTPREVPRHAGARLVKRSE